MQIVSENSIFHPIFNISMTEYLSVAIQAAIESGSAIMEIYSDPFSDFQVEKKADHSPVTIADKRAHEIISAFLATTPYPVLSEEGVHDDFQLRREWETLWIVDPLDGTKEFIKKNGEFTVNIALVKNGEPIAGVVYAPVLKKLYFGSVNDGAFKVENVEPEKNPDIDKLLKRDHSLPDTRNGSTFVVVASRSHLSPQTTAFIDQLKQDHENIDLISKGSSLKICLIAEGSADIYPRFAPTMEWDTAAGHALIKASGGEIYQVDGITPLLYNKENLLNPWFIAKRAK